MRKLLIILNRQGLKKVFNKAVYVIAVSIFFANFTIFSFAEVKTRAEGMSAETFDSSEAVAQISSLEEDYEELSVEEVDSSGGAEPTVYDVYPLEAAAIPAVNEQEVGSDRSLYTDTIEDKDEF